MCFNKVVLGGPFSFNTFPSGLNGGGGRLGLGGRTDELLKEPFWLERLEIRGRIFILGAGGGTSGLGTLEGLLGSFGEGEGDL